ncbi:MFS transporter [Nocardioides carbamazepini]|uniref:Cmx/CmrA family chloramphenicol efflux MFS transporter n=1 Tax=Nocardioides carbamazepini TaxID=2854259 RepID=UPI002149FE23|nr:Cmx/CmrA family chloramphenicol efflux MFS transporter [Nocardioides carbamazepini]MCR1784480.1 MFS transporter [Nocardioides carbamazepini]
MPLALYLLALTTFAMGTSEFMLAGLVPDIADGLGVPVGTAGLLTSAFAVGMMAGAPVMAAFARRWPERSTLLGCVAVFALAHALAAVTPSFAPLFVARVVAALANAGFLAVAIGTATRLVAPDRKGRALAVLLAGTTLATVAGVPAGALLGAALGWRATFWAIALLCVLAALGIVRGVPARTDPTGEDAEAGPSLRVELAQLRRPSLMVAMLLGALVNGGTFAAFTFLAPVVTGVAGLDELWVPVVLVLFGAGSFVGVALAGRLSDRRPGLVTGAGTPLLLLGWVALAVLAAHPVALLVAVFVQGMLAFAVGSTWIARVLYAASGAPTMAGSYATAALNAGATAGPVLGAMAISGAGERGPVWVAAALSGIALVVTVAVRRPGATASRAPSRTRR